MSDVKYAKTVRWFVKWGTDSRHLTDAQMCINLFEAKQNYAFCPAKAKQLVRIEYHHRMSEGDKITVLAEQIA